MWDLSPLTRIKLAPTLLLEGEVLSIGLPGSPKDLKIKRIGSIDLRHGG